MSNSERVLMLKMMERRFALAATKSSVSLSSLSKVMIGAALPASAVARALSNRSLRRCRLPTKTAKFSAAVHAF